MSSHSYGPSIPPSLFDKSNIYSFGSPPIAVNDLFTFLGNPYFSGSDKPPVEPSPSEVHALLSSPSSLATSPASSLAITVFNFSAPRYSSNQSTDRSKTPPTSVHSSPLVFHLGASGHAKKRSSEASSARAFLPPPLRPHPFQTPAVESPRPEDLRSVAVGEDAYFTRIDGMCVADGVGGWASAGRDADAGKWSRLLTHFCERETEAWWAADRAQESEHVPESGARTSRKILDPVEIMQRGYEKCLSCMLHEVSLTRNHADHQGVHGSSTCLLALLHDSRLLIANLGDCCLMLIREGKIVHRTTEMLHAFNYPLQIGTNGREEPMKDAERSEVPVERDDVVVVGSDGLMDNLVSGSHKAGSWRPSRSTHRQYDSDVLDTLSQFGPWSPRTPPSSRPPSPSKSNLPRFDPQEVAEALCARARGVSKQTNIRTPFMDRAVADGMDFSGGKKDGELILCRALAHPSDISVLVGVIGDRDPAEPSLSNLTLHAARQ